MGQKFSDSKKSSGSSVSSGSVTQIQGAVGLLDVDHTLLFSAGCDPSEPGSFNNILVHCLLQYGVRDIYLFTDMTFSTHSVQERLTLVRMLQLRGFTVHGVITPCDLVWSACDSKEIALLHAMCTDISQYKGKFYGKQFEEFVLSCSTDLPQLSRAVTSYFPLTNQPGVAFGETAELKTSGGNLEIPDNVQLSHAQKLRSVWAKAVPDHIADKLGYIHTKGLMLDHFLRHCIHKQNKFSSIIVCDDNKAVNKCIAMTTKQFTSVLQGGKTAAAKLGESAGLGSLTDTLTGSSDSECGKVAHVQGTQQLKDRSTLLPVITMVEVTAVDTDSVYYTQLLDQHYQRVMASIVL